MSVRNEKETDHRHVEELIRKAFYNLYVPGCTEHYLARVMRGHEAVSYTHLHLCLVQRSETPPQPARIRRHMLCPIRQRNGIKYKIPPARAAIFSPAFPKYRHTFGLLPLKTPSQGYRNRPRCV